MSEKINIEELFGKNVFTLEKMRERLPRNVYKELVNVMEKGGELSMPSANVIAKAMKDMENPSTERMSARMHELAEKALKEIECGT